MFAMLYHFPMLLELPPGILRFSFPADDLDGESGVGDYAILLCRSRPVIQDIVKDAGCFGDCLTAIQFRFRCAGET